jgi:hypothetical protein
MSDLRPSTIHSPSGLPLSPLAVGRTRTLTRMFPLPSDLEARLSPTLVSGLGVELSAGSSYVVADVEYDSWAEELRLWGSDPTLTKPSDMRMLVMDFPSPLPFRKLGVPGLKLLCMDSLDDLDFRAVRGLSLASGLGGTLPLPSPRGGCGNELMLTVFLIVLGVVGFAFETPLGWGKADIGEGLGGGGRCVVEGARRPLWGVFGADLGDGMLPVLLRVLLTGKAGRAIFGGPFEGPDGRGSVVVMVARESRKATTEERRSRTYSQCPR